MASVLVGGFDPAAVERLELRARVKGRRLDVS
jgi:hypothetical protein